MPDAGETSRPQKPWWREPLAMGFFALILLASLAVLLQGYVIQPKPVDPTKPDQLPAAGTFCDPPTPVQSTAYNPSTQFAK